MKEAHMHCLLRRRALPLGGAMAGAASPFRAGAWRPVAARARAAAARGGPWGERARPAGALGPAAELSQVLDAQLPERVRRLVYLSAFLVPHGKVPEALNAQDNASLIGTAVRRSPRGAALVIDPALARGVRPRLLRRRRAGGNAAAVPGVGRDELCTDEPERATLVAAWRASTSSACRTEPSSSRPSAPCSPPCPAVRWWA
jgi:pimeloyl-ACP methyl ester carboxylesterase